MLKRKEENKVLYVYMHVIMKIMCPPSYRQNTFVATHALVTYCWYQ